MMPRLSLLVAACLLVACAEKPQTLGGSAAASDTAAHTGTGKAAYSDAGWKAGDKTSWESHLKARAQHGQNDLSRN